MPPSKKQKGGAAPMASGSLMAMFKAVGARNKEGQPTDAKPAEVRVSVSIDAKPATDNKLETKTAPPILRVCDSADATKIAMDTKCPAIIAVAPVDAQFATDTGPASCWQDSPGVGDLHFPSVTSEDFNRKAHAVIDLAKSGKWEELYTKLDNNKALVNVRPNVREYAVLHQAAFHGKEDVVKVLIEKYGADSSLLTKSGDSAADIAKSQGHASLVTQLTFRIPATIGGEPDLAKKQKAIAGKSCAPSGSKLKKQRTIGASVTVESTTSGSASAGSSAGPGSEAVFVESRKPSAFTSFTSEEILQKAHAAIDSAKAGNWEVLYDAIECQNDIVNVRPEVREYAVLHQVAHHGDETVLNSLIDKYGADPQIQTKMGETALDIAKRQGHVQVVQSLVSRCPPRMFTRFDTLSPVKETKKGVAGPMPTPVFTDALIKEAHLLIDFAKEAEWDQVYKNLDKRPELVNVRPVVREYGILHQAVYHGAEEAVDTLIRKYGADSDMRTGSGNTTVFVATMQGHSHIAMSLEGKDTGIQSAEDGKDEDFDFKQMPDGSWKVVPVSK